MTRRFAQLAWAAAVATYLLIILGAIVRITGSGMGCGEHWPLCNGSLLPPLDLPTMIEYGHRLAAAAVSLLVIALAVYAWRIRREAGRGKGDESSYPPRSATTAAYVALVLIAFEVTLGRFVVKFGLPAVTVIVHLANAMLILAALLVATRRAQPVRAKRSGVALGAAVLGFVTVLLGALVANMGAAGACVGFPLCNGEWMPTGGGLQHIHWTHRLFAYALTVYLVVWALKGRARGARHVLILVALQVAIAAAMVMHGLPPILQAVHVAIGAAVWAALVLAAL